MRVANLNMDATGKITGKIDMSYIGAAALRWRHTPCAETTRASSMSSAPPLEDMHPSLARGQGRHRLQRCRLRESAQGHLHRRRNRRQLDRQTPRHSRGPLPRQPQGHLPAREARDRRRLQLPAAALATHSASTSPPTSPSRPLRPTAKYSLQSDGCLWHDHRIRYPPASPPAATTPSAMSSSFPPNTLNSAPSTRSSKPTTSRASFSNPPRLPHYHGLHPRLPAN